MRCIFKVKPTVLANSWMGTRSSKRKQLTGLPGVVTRDRMGLRGWERWESK